MSSSQRPDNVVAPASPTEFGQTKSPPTPTYEIEKLWAQKYGNYCVFVQSIAEYLPEARSWAQGLQYMPLMAFKLRLAGYFTEAVRHARHKNTVERDKAVALVIRSNAKLHGFNVEKVRADDYIKLLRYGSLFCLLLAEE
jgi:hypothetical protein